MEQRVDKVLAELTSRYSLTERFLTQLRPMLVSILGDDQLAEHRTELLEQVAETCQRDLEMRRAFDSLRKNMAEYFAGLFRKRQDGMS